METRIRNWEGVRPSPPRVPYSARQFFYQVKSGYFFDIEAKWEFHRDPNTGRESFRCTGLKNPPLDGSPIEEYDVVARVYDVSEQKKCSILEAYVQVKGEEEFSTAWLKKATAGPQVQIVPFDPNGRNRGISSAIASNDTAVSVSERNPVTKTMVSAKK